MTAARALMTGLVDYAGLFPPAGLEMVEAVRRYRAYLMGKDRWALGRFVLPAARLGKFSAAFNEVCCGERERVWGLSVLASGDAKKDMAAVAGLARGAVSVDGFELKAGSHPADEDLSAGAPGSTVGDVERLLAAYGVELGQRPLPMSSLRRSGRRSFCRCWRGWGLGPRSEPRFARVA